MTNTGDLMIEVLAKKTMSRIEHIGRIARQMDYDVYIVGGCVRDLLCQRRIIDVDIGVVGDAIALAESVGISFPCKVKRHLRYRNAALLFDDGEKIDLATARREIYPEPAAWPVVEASDINDDLARRDFSINSMAINIEPERFGSLVDPHNGRNDLKAGLIRALHEKSFVDDPTRILRAFRFAGRFGFQIENETAQWMSSFFKQDIRYASARSRMAAEMMIIYTEEDPRPALLMIRQSKIREAIHQNFLDNDYIIELFDKIIPVIEWLGENQPGETIETWKVWLLAAYSSTSTRAIRNFLKRINHPDLSLIEDLRGIRRVHQSLLHDRVTKDSGFANAFTPLSTEALLVLMAKTPNRKVRDAVERYLKDLRRRKLGIRGADLQKLGMTPGPEMGRILKEVKNALYDGEVKGRAEQLELAKKLSEGL